MACNTIQTMSSSQMIKKCDVFVSFRGKDTRNGFTDHLFAALHRKDVRTFRDDDKLKKGEAIAPELLRAIEGSLVFIVVFSENYASSTWCLRELAKIVDCLNVSSTKRVLPVFYDVDPSEVRRQSGNYEKAFAEHEERFRQDLDMLQTWKAALTHVANLSGWDVRDKPQNAEIEKIVEETIVTIRLSNHKFSSLPNDLRMTRKLDSIEDVDDTRETWKLAIRIINLWYVQGSPSAGFMGMIFMDKKGDKIQAQVKILDIENRKRELKEGSSYIVQNFEVENNSGQYKASNHPYKLNFVKATIVEEHDLSEIPQYVYNFTRFEDILGGHACADVLVDVIGQFVKFHPESKKKEVVFSMKDQGSNILNFTLWGQCATKLVSSLDKLPSGPVVVLLTLAKIKYLYGSILVLNSMYGSKLFINENIPKAEIDQFKNSLDPSQISIPSYSQRISQLSSSSQLTSEDKFFQTAQVKSIAGLNKLNQECICVTVATIDKVIVKNGWNYDGCSKCTRKGDSSVTSFICSFCGHNDIGPRFRIEVKVSHQKEIAKFVLWDRECFQLIKETAGELKKKLMDEDEFNPMTVPLAVDNVLRRTLAFRVKVQPSCNRCSVIQLSEDASIIESIVQKILSIKDSATTEKGKSVCSGHKMDDLCDSQFMSATADNDPDLLRSLTPAKRLTCDTQLDDLAYEDLTSIQLSSTKLTKHIKTK